MPRCPRCGSDVADGSAFCAACGAPVPAGRGRAAAAAALALLAAGALALLALRPAAPAPAPTYRVRVRAVAEGLGGDGSRVPLRVTGETAAGEAVDLGAYVGAGGGTVEVAAGSYVIAVAGSPIAADGRMYQWEGAALEVEIPEGTETDEEVDAGEDITLPPVADDADVTDGEIEAAAALVRADPERGDDAADGLSEAATARRDAAVAGREAAEAAEASRVVADAYGAVLDAAATYDYGGNGRPTGPYRYALVDMDGAEPPELLLGATYSTGDTFFLVFYHDAAAGEARRAEGDPIQWGSGLGLGVAADGPGLVSSYLERGSFSQSRVTLSGGALVWEGAGGGVIGPEGPEGGVATVDLDLRDASDRSALEALGGEGAGAPKAAGAGTHDFECEYFYVDVPDSWAGRWSVTQLEPARWSFGEDATVEYNNEGDAVGGSGAYVAVAAEAPDPYYRALGTTSGGLTVWAFEAGGSFFASEFSEGATLTVR